ncbi:MAG TPA: hypothetical protein DEV73_00695 [Candidatus Zambryskibacteria bacterium]|nr:hypothetical protein [Candidatus Zambryskibacteria bacterium]
MFLPTRKNGLNRPKLRNYWVGVETSRIASDAGAFLQNIFCKLICKHIKLSNLDEIRGGREKESESYLL